MERDQETKPKRDRYREIELWIKGLAVIGAAIAFVVSVCQFRASDTRELKLLLLKERVAACNIATDLIANAAVLGESETRVDSIQMRSHHFARMHVFFNGGASERFVAFVDLAKKCEMKDEQSCNKEKLRTAQAAVSEACRVTIQTDWKEIGGAS